MTRIVREVPRATGQSQSHCLAGLYAALRTNTGQTALRIACQRAVPMFSHAVRAAFDYHIAVSPARKRTSPQGRQQEKPG